MALIKIQLEQLLAAAEKASYTSKIEGSIYDAAYMGIANPQVICELVQEVLIVRERLGPAGYKILQDVVKQKETISELQKEIANLKLDRDVINLKENGLWPNAELSREELDQRWEQYLHENAKSYEHLVFKQQSAIKVLSEALEEVSLDVYNDSNLISLMAALTIKCIAKVALAKAQEILK